MGKNNYNKNIIGLFGLYIRGKANPISDIDLLVELEKDADLFYLIGLSNHFKRCLM